MADERGQLREIAWQEVFPWLRLVRVMRLAVAPRLLALAAVAMVATTIGWRGVGLMYSGSSDSTLTAWIQADSHWAWEPIRMRPGFGELLDPAHSPASVLVDPRYSPALTTASWLANPVYRMFDINIGFVPFTYTLLCSLWAVAVWGLFGGAITRIASLAMAREERLGMAGAVRYSLGKWPSYFFAPLFPLFGIALLSGLGLVLGLFMRFDVGLVLASILWPLLLVAGVVMAVLAAGLLFGWVLMWPTISVEGTDSFDALSRSYSYTFQRPFYYFFHAAIAAVLGTVGWIVVWLFARLIIEMSFWAASWGSGAERMSHVTSFLQGSAITPEVSSSFQLGMRIIGFWIAIVMLFANAYIFSYFWTAATGIYFLLRQKVDGTEPDEVAVDEEAEPHGLPPLETDDTGLPRPDGETPLAPSPPL